MIIDDIKKANIEAMKSKDANLRSIYSVLINKHMQAAIEARAVGKEISDDEMVKIIQKTIKELTEEAENYKKVNHMEEFNKINMQKAALENYLPKMLSAAEIQAEIGTLTDKSVPVVMRHFKAKYGSTVDLKLVGDILKTM